MMKLLGIIILVLSLTKLCIIGSSEKYELEQDLYNSIKNDVEKFHNQLTMFVIIDSLIGISVALLLI